jgi:hypothetical protein
LKKIMIVGFVVLMAAAMLATPLISIVIAKETVDAELHLTGQKIVLGNVWTTNGSIQQQKGNTPTYYGNLIIGEDDPYPMVIVCTSSVTLNTETGYFVGYYDTVCYVAEEGSDSGFKGMIIGKMYDFDPLGFPPLSRAIIHCTLQGFGDFEGQTLKLSVDGDLFAYFTWIGYCIR